MARGRKRKFNPSIPAHIDQSALPPGVYWEHNRWYVLEEHPEGGGRVKVTVARAAARLSELHAIMEGRRTGRTTGTLTYLDRKFRESSEWRELSKSTRDDYTRHGDLACAFVMRDGSKLGDMQIERMTVPGVQRLVEAFATGWAAAHGRPAAPARPTTANHVLRYLRRLFAWGIRHGHCKHNPAVGVRAAKERREHHMPAPDAFAAVLAHAKARAALPLHSKGGIPPYIPAVMVLAYNARLRGIEVTDLTDADELPEGVRSARRKGSLDTITAWNPDLRWAWDWLTAYRAERIKAHRRPVPIAAEARKLLVTQEGTPLSRSALKSAWQRIITSAIEQGVITEEQRFSLHGLKHRGVTDTRGTRADKQQAAGHVSPAMTALYDHEVPVVQPPQLPGRKPR
ncbi:site-specific integrase [[Pseudomonas] boreopolis]|uniref:Integrase n=1 Tax=Xanthomonas boreopolis TaxID=86183 RepID=A0A919KIC6_9XANT|nr:integrase [[Pseudomonas] boreopolis]